MRTFTVNGDQAEIFIPMMKFDARTGEYEGWASIEERDGHKQICDIEKSWPAIVGDAQDMLEISGGRKVGVLRRQHDRTKPIGYETLIERRERDGVPGIFTKGIITDEQSKSDAATGVLSGLSYRGLIQTWPDETQKDLTRYAWKLREETSAVDRPAVPHALIEVMKSDGSTELVKARGYEPPQGFLCRANVFHARKDEARQCDSDHEGAKSLPDRVEATKGDAMDAMDVMQLINSPEFAEAVKAITKRDAKPAEKKAAGNPLAFESRKSLYAVGNLASILISLQSCASDTAMDEMYEAANGAGNAATGQKAIATLKTAVSATYDAIQAMIEDERVEFEAGDEEGSAPYTAEMAMADSMRMLRALPKEQLKSLRVPAGNGSKSTAEDEMDEKNMVTEEAMKAYADNAVSEAMKASNAKIAEIEKQIDDIGANVVESNKALAQTLAVTHQVKVADPTNLTEVLKAIADKPAPARAMRTAVPVKKSEDGEAQKNEGAGETELSTLEKLSPQNLTRVV